MDFANVSVNGVLVIPFVIGWVQLLKEYVDTKYLKLIAVVLGLFAFTVPELATMYPVIEPWVNLIFYGLGGALAAGGLYDTAKQLVKE